jgi:hypothetical protein
MPSLTAQDILAVWEAGQNQHPVDRALTVLGSGFPDWTRGRLASLPLGQRDRMLLELRAQVFGDAMTAVTRCPKCGESLEVPILLSQIASQRSAVSSHRSAFTLRSGKLEIRFRLPNSVDQGAAAASIQQSAVGSQPSVAGQVILQRCITGIRQGKKTIRAEYLPDKVADAVEARMAELDPLAEITFDITCPQCGNAWEELLDPATFLWAELAAEAKRLLSEVHVLARAYGWRESDILSLSEQRRHHYLELAS